MHCGLHRLRVAASAELGKASLKNRKTLKKTFFLADISSIFPINNKGLISKIFKIITMSQLLSKLYDRDY